MIEKFVKYEYHRCEPFSGVRFKLLDSSSSRPAAEMKLFLLNLVVHSIGQTHGFNPINNQNELRPHRPLSAFLCGDSPIEDSTDDRLSSMRRRQVMGAFLFFSGSLLAEQRALANVPLDAISDGTILDNLKAPTSDQPRIPLPTQGTKANTLEGMPLYSWVLLEMLTRLYCKARSL